MSENDNTGTEEEYFSLHSVHGWLKIEGNSLRGSRTPLLSVEMVQKRLERSARLFKDLKKHGNRIFIFSMKKISQLIVSSKQMIGAYILVMISLNNAECQQPSIQP